MTKDSHLIFEAYLNRLVKEETTPSPVTSSASADIGPDVGPVGSNLDFPDLDSGYKTNPVYYKNKHARIQDPVAQSIFDKLPRKLDGSEVGAKIQEIMREQEPPIERKNFMGILEELIKGKAFYGLPPSIEGAPQTTQQDVQSAVEELPAYRMALRQARMETEN